MAASRLVATARLTKPSIDSPTPKTRALVGAIRPDGIGRVQVRAITASMSRSNQQLTADAPPAERAPPARATSVSDVPGQPRAAAIMVQSSVISSNSRILGLVRLR